MASPSVTHDRTGRLSSAVTIFGYRAVKSERVRDGIAFNRHFAGDGAIIFKHACALGCEGIVSKRLGSTYRRLNPFSPSGMSSVSVNANAVALRE
jgi:ATP-dependent DNA ligase